MKREYETRYWVDARVKKPISRGFPKQIDGSARGAGKAIMAGFASKVQCINRVTGRVLWTAQARKIDGVGSAYGVELVRGDDVKPSRRKE